MKNIYSILADTLDKEDPLALATIIETSGSTPQVKGASAVFSATVLVAGTVGGGVLEGEVKRMATRSLQSNSSLWFEYNLDTDISSAGGALCGGRVSIIIDSMLSDQKEVFRDIDKSLSDNIPGVLATIITAGKDNLVETGRKWIKAIHGKLSPDDTFLQEYQDEIISCFKEKSCSLIEIKPPESTIKKQGNFLFIQALYPLPELIIAGAGHIGKALSHLASLLDFEVTVIDDRQEYANPQNLPDADSIVVKPIGSAMKNSNYGRDTYVVIVTRGHKDDAAALKACIHSNAAYIGMIGSKRKIRLMREEFIDKGWAGVEQFDRVFAPIGLEIQSKTVQEIAVSICAQLVLIRQHNASGRNRPVITAMILAAGESKRMGQPKMVMPFGETTVIEQVIKETSRSRTDHIHVVTGAFPGMIKKKTEAYPVSHSENKNYKSGMITSIQCGIQNMRKETTAVIILLGDQPMIRSTVMDELIAAYIESDKGIIQAVFNGERGHPVIIDKKYFSEIVELTDNKNLRDLVKAHPGDILEVNTDSPEVLRDIDTLEDYESEIKYLKNHD